MRNIFGRLQATGFALLLAIGAATALALLGAIAAALVRDIAMPEKPDDRLVILDDGQLIVSSPSGKFGTTTYSTLDGKNIDIRKHEQLSARDLPAQPARFAKLDWMKRIVRVYPGDDNCWFLVHDGNLRGRAYLVGYDQETAALVGYFGAKGFGSEKPAGDDCFRIDGRVVQNGNAVLDRIGDKHHGLCLVTEDGLTRVDTAKQTVRVFAAVPQIVSAAVLDGKLLVRVPKRIIVLDADGKELRSYAIPSQLLESGTCEPSPCPFAICKRFVVRNHDIRCFSPTKDGTLVLQSPETNEFFWIEPTGRFVRHEPISLRGAMSARREFFTTVISMAEASPVFSVAAWRIDQYRNAKRFATVEELERSDVRWMLCTAGMFGLIFAWLCWQRQREYGQPWTGTWTVFVLLLGLPGYLGYIAHRSWPARLPCPNCTKLAPRDRQACLACGQDFPPPQPKGTEVFG